MSRWSYLLPRLLLVGSIVLIACLVINPLVRWVSIQMGEAVTLAKWDIAKAETSLPGKKIGWVGVQVADPRSPMKNLFQADEIVLAIEPTALASQCLVVNKGRISGLRFDTDRTTSGKVDLWFCWRCLQWVAAKLPPVSIDSQQVASAMDQGLQKLLQLLQRDVTQQIEQLESVKLAKQLMVRWPAEFTRMESRAEELRVRIEQLKTTAGTPSNNPQQQLQAASKIAKDVEQLTHDLEQFTTDLEHLKQQALSDKDAIIAAQKHDAEQIQQLFRCENLNPEEMSEYLLRQALGNRVLAVVQWVRYVGNHLPQRLPEVMPIRMRGQDIAFPFVKKYPDFLCRSLAVDGEINFNNQPLKFQGLLTGVSTQPEMLGEPLMAHLQVEGPATMRVEVAVDQTGPTPHQRVIFDCPALPQPECVLGQPNQLAVTIAPGNIHLWVSLDLAGDNLTGQLQVLQSPIRIVPTIASSSALVSTLTASLQAGAAQIHSVGIVVDLSGTIDHPTWKIQSDLGPQIVATVNTTIHQAMDAQSKQFAVAVNQRVQSELNSFDSMLQTRYDAVLAKQGLNKNQIQQLTSLTTAPVPGIANAAAAVSAAVKSSPTNTASSTNSALPALPLPKKLF